MSASNTICNSPSPPLANIILFGIPLKVFRTRLQGRGFHTLIKNVSFSSPNDVRSHNPTSSGPRVLADTHSPLQSMWDLTIHPLSGPSVLAGTPPSVWHCNSSSPLLVNFFLFGLSLKVFKTRLLGRSFHTLIKNVSFSSPNNVRSHNPPPFRTSVLADTCSPLQSMWDLTLNMLNSSQTISEKYENITSQTSNQMQH